MLEALAFAQPCCIAQPQLHRSSAAASAFCRIAHQPPEIPSLSTVQVENLSGSYAEIYYL
jgi:hypothetical protein